MLKKSYVLVLSFIFLVLSFNLIYATSSTHIWAPSTDVQAYKKWHLTSDFYAPTEKSLDGSRAATITNLGLTVGVLPNEKINAEVGFDHKTGLGSLDDYPMYFNVKVGTPENAYGNSFPALAVGVFDIGTKKDATDANVFYGKAAKSFKVEKLDLGRFSLGYFSGNSKLLLDGNGEKDNTGALVAWERTIPEVSDKLWLCVEYMGSKSAYGSMNYGFSWKFSDNASVIFGYDAYNNKDLPSTFTIQTDIDF
ncbi:hypothetical protein HZA55_01810 [Candidatus Poribacteria bacterium]|nr:hypothetical protein [Candidatus Poribacteria bacterium]